MNSAELAAGSPAWRGILSSPAAQLVVLTLIGASTMFARTALHPLQEVVRTGLSLADHEIALLQGPALALPSVAASIPIGMLIDRVARAKLLFVFGLVAFLATGATALAPNLPLLAVSRALVGAATIATTLAIFSVLGDLFEPTKRGRATMIVVLGQYGGMSAAFAVGGTLLALLGTGDGSWRWAMAGMAVPPALALVLGLGFKEPLRAATRSERIPFAQSVGTLWSHKALLLPPIIGLVLAETAMFAALVWAVPALLRRFSMAPEEAGVIMALAVLTGGVAGPILGGILADFSHRNGGPRRTFLMLGGLSLLAAPAGLFAIGPSVTVASMMLVLFMVLVGAVLVAGLTLFTVVVPSEGRATGLAFLAGAQLLIAGALAPIAISGLSALLGGASQLPQALAASSAVIALVAAAAFLGGRHLIAKDG